MKKILENYLYLLTEDETVESFDKTYKELRQMLKNFRNKHNPEAIAAKYANVAKDQIPENDRKILDAHRDLTDQFAKVSKKRAEYSEWIRKGGNSKTFKAVKDAAESKMRYNAQAYEDLIKARNAFMARMNKVRKIQKGVAAVYFIFIAFMLYKHLFSKAARACSHYTGYQKRICLTQYKINATNKEIISLKASLSKSSESKDPEKFKQKINERIIELEVRLKKLNKRINYFKSLKITSNKRNY
jgi:hypothetical protein